MFIRVVRVEESVTLNNTNDTVYVVEQSRFEVGETYYLYLLFIWDKVVYKQYTKCASNLYKSYLYKTSIFNTALLLQGLAAALKIVRSCALHTGRGSGYMHVPVAQTPT